MCACRTLLVSLFPQRVILTRFGATSSMTPLVAIPTRYSLISDVVCGCVVGLFLSTQENVRMPYLVGIAFPSAGHPDPIRGYAIPGCAGRDTHKILVDQ